MRNLRFKAFVVLAIAVTMLSGGFAVGSVRAPALTITETQITTDPEAQGWPAIHGDRIVWQDWRNPPAYSDIYMYDLSTSTETPITIRRAEQQSPAIYGDRIVWEDNRDSPPGESISNIYVYDLSTETETPITTDPVNQLNPVIYGDRIVWEDWGEGVLHRDIYMYDLSTETETQITTDPADQKNPAIYGDRIVWFDDRDFQAIGDIYMYDLSTSTETPISTDPADQYNPVIYGDRIVWVDTRNGNSDIYMYDLSTETETQITTDPSNQRAPAIYGDRIVWFDDRNGNNDIFMAELSYGPTPSDAIEKTEEIKTIAADPSQIPRSDFDGATDRVKDNRRNALLNRLDAVIIDIETAMTSTNTTVQETAYQSAIDQLNSLLEKTDGCSERGTPDTQGSGYTPDWITTCVSQALIDPLIRELITMLQDLLAQIP